MLLPLYSSFLAKNDVIYCPLHFFVLAQFAEGNNRSLGVSSLSRCKSVFLTCSKATMLFSMALQDRASSRP